MRRNKSKKNTYIKKGVLVLLFILLGGILYAWFHFSQLSSFSSLESYAEKIMQHCKDSKIRSLCYTKEIPQLVFSPSYLSMEQAFSITRMIQEKDTSFPYCHIVGHKLGAEELKRHPNEWEEVLTRCPIASCNGGCTHGVLQEKFRSESLTDQQIHDIKKDIIRVCQPRKNWNPTNIEVLECFHALGHLNMYLTKGNIQKSLTFCDEYGVLAKTDEYVQNCYDGAFMQIFQPLEPDDFALIKGKIPENTSPDTYCNQFSERKRDSCLTESRVLRMDELTHPSFLESFCSQKNIFDHDRCYGVLLASVISAYYQYDVAKITNYCEQLSDDANKALCFYKAAFRFAYTNSTFFPEAIRFCEKSEQYSTTQPCFKKITDYFYTTFKPGSKEHEYVCQLLPLEWQKDCT